MFCVCHLLNDHRKSDETESALGVLPERFKNSAKIQSIIRDEEIAVTYCTGTQCLK